MMMVVMSSSTDGRTTIGEKDQTQSRPTQDGYPGRAVTEPVVGRRRQASDRQDKVQGGCMSDVV
jgi:hypothetical protein